MIWIHVDDVFIHGPTAEKLITTGLNYVMNTALCLGLICQPAKTKPPNQVQKFCGFIHDTVDIPCLRVPKDKLSRGRSFVQYLVQVQETRLARLTCISSSTWRPTIIGSGYARKYWGHLSLLFI